MNAPVVSNVFIAFQDNEESRPIIDAILADNPKPLPCIRQGW